MKKVLSVCAALIMGLCLFCGCKEEEKAEPIAGKFYSLEEAYESEWLTKEDLMSIAYYLNNGRQGNEEIMAEDYAPIPKTPEILNEKTKEAIKQEFWEKHAQIFTLEEIGIQYYGSYGNCIAIEFWCGNTASDVIRERYVGGVYYFYDSMTLSMDNVIMVWIQE